MKDEETQTTAPAATSQKEGFCGGLFGRGRYKIWVLGAIVLLALWSMFTTSVTLKWSAVNLKHSSDALDLSIHGDLDVLDLDERERMVRHMWDVYSHSTSIRLPSFWREAFEAAYQDLTSEVASIQDAAISEIAKMSFLSRDIYESPPVQSTRRYSTSKDEVAPRRLLRKT
ncbi:uncharacterized protein LOC111393890 [Olea europaea var. sylvestris]|uniref:uncharacterized protein LOC111393890 n=1 Tax=Olea europaea var. sylvestris TaxID=158386 RepID=UPI000C1D037B|nr:uncharacterized protein LOC111393890 [Olea europaea var. sylvestris]